MSLWGTKKNDDQNDQDHPEGAENGESAENMPRNSQDSRRRDPTERDRLLPSRLPPPHSDGYLDPDDPAVSVLVCYQYLQN